MTFGRDTKKSIWWDLLTFWKACEREAVHLQFIWAILVLTIKLSKKHQKAGWRTKDDCLLLTGGEHEANQCTPNQSSIRGAPSLGVGDWTERHDWQMIFICNIMDYNCRDELIITLALAAMKKVTAGQRSNNLCLLDILIIKSERVMQQVKCGPVVIRCAIASVLTDIQLYKDLNWI